MILTSPHFLILAVLLTAVPLFLKITRLASLSWRTVGVSMPVLLLAFVMAGHWLLNTTATEVSVLWSPDHKQRVVVYVLPFYYSWPPRGGSDAPGFARAYDENGKCFGQVKLAMIQNAADITWFDDLVEIGSTTLRWDGSN